MKRFLILVLSLIFTLSIAVFGVACEGGFGGSVNLGGGQDNTGDGNDDGSGDGGNTDDGGNDDTGNDDTGNGDNTGDDQTETEYTDENGVTYELLTNGTYSVKSVGGSATITIPEQVNGKTVTAIGVDAFRGKKLLTTVVLPQTVKTIGTAAFKDCTKLKEINLEKVEKLGDNAFEKAFSTTIAKINLFSLSEIGSNVFENCIKLHTVDFTGSTFVDVPTKVFAACSVLYKVVFPETLRNIGNHAFNGCANLTVINLENVEVIGKYAFVACKSLPSANLPSVVDIKAFAFYQCAALTRVDIGPNCDRIFTSAFEDDKALVEVYVDMTNPEKVWNYFFVNASTGLGTMGQSDTCQGSIKYREMMLDASQCAILLNGTKRYNKDTFFASKKWCDEHNVVYQSNYYPIGTFQD